MYELVQVGAKTYYVESPAKVGVYRLSDTDVCLIDSGNDRDAAKKVQKLMEQQKWVVTTIINTHSHADHIGGNHFFQQNGDVRIFAPPKELYFVENTPMEAAMVYGGCPPKVLQNKFLKAKESSAIPIDINNPLPGLTYVALPGHCLDMVGVKTSDGVWFLADSVMSPEVLDKYHVSYLYDIKRYLESLDKVAALAGTLFIGAHAEPTEDIAPLVALNRNKVGEIVQVLLDICAQPIAFEEVLKQTFDHYGLFMTMHQYTLVGSTIRSYLSYLHNAHMVETQCIDNRLLWQTKSK